LINKKAQQIALDFEFAMQDPWKTNSLSINIYAMQDNNQQKNCVICDNHFTVKSLKSRRKTCCRECAVIHHKNTINQWHAVNNPPKSKESTCRNCGKPTIGTKRKKDYCTVKCYQTFNKEAVKAKQQERYDRLSLTPEYRQRARDYQANRRINDGDHVRSVARQYCHRKKNDPVWKMKRKVHIRLHDVCKFYQLPYKTTASQSQTYLGISMEEYVTYLESKFVDGMSWNNMDEWQIDHIIPFRSFDLTNEEEMFKAFNYTNTQPLFVKEHQIKSIIERGKTVHMK